MQGLVPAAVESENDDLARFFRHSGSLGLDSQWPGPNAAGSASAAAGEAPEAGVSDESEDMPLPQGLVATDFSALPPDPLPSPQDWMAQPLLMQASLSQQSTAQPVVSVSSSAQGPMSIAVTRVDVSAVEWPAPVTHEESPMAPPAAPGVEGALSAVLMPTPPIPLVGWSASSPSVQAGQSTLARAQPPARAGTPVPRPDGQPAPPALAEVSSLVSAQDSPPPADDFMAPEAPGALGAPPGRALADSIQVLTPLSQGVVRQIAPTGDVVLAKEPAPLDHVQFAKLSVDGLLRSTEADSAAAPRVSRRPAGDEPAGRQLAATGRVPEAAHQDFFAPLVPSEAARRTPGEAAAPQVEASLSPRQLDSAWVQASGPADLRPGSSTHPVEWVTDTPEAALANTVTYWATQGIQNAELKLDAWGGEALEVSISMNGNHTEIEFRTDQPEIRQVIESAMPQLKDMLAQDGLVLSGVAVGGSGGQGSDSPTKRPPMGSRQSRVMALQDEVEPTRSRSAMTGIGRSLDLFV